MASPPRLRKPGAGRRDGGRLGRLAAGLGTCLILQGTAAIAGGGVVGAAGGAGAAGDSPNQPEAIRVRGLPPPPCPLVVPAREAMLQPLRIDPALVPLKNRMGCLSAADALYGKDGCPVRLCGENQGVMPLPGP